MQGDRSTRPHLVAFDESDGSSAWDDEIQGGAIFASSPAIGGGQVLVAFSGRGAAGGKTDPAMQDGAGWLTPA